MTEVLDNKTETELVFPGELLVIGPYGLVGSRVVEILGKNNQIFGASREHRGLAEGLLKDYWNIDIEDRDSIRKVIKSFPGKFVINCAAQTKVDEVELQRPKEPYDFAELRQTPAYRANVLSTRYILEACYEYDKTGIFIGSETAYVETGQPHSEDDQLVADFKNSGLYAWTKAEQVRTLAGDYILANISYPYRRGFMGKRDFGRDAIALLKKYQETGKWPYPIFNDQKLTPTFVDDIPFFITKAVTEGLRGVYNLASPSEVTPYDFYARVIKTIDPSLDPVKIMGEPGSIEKYNLNRAYSAKRPVVGALKTDKVLSAGFTPTDWKEGVIKAYSGLSL